MRYTTSEKQIPLTKEEIIAKYAKDRQIEKWINNITKTSAKDTPLEDLAQDMYVFLYEMDREKIEQLYESGELPFFMNRVLINNIISTSSQYFTKYIKPSRHEQLIKE